MARCPSPCQGRVPGPPSRHEPHCPHRARGLRARSLAQDPRVPGPARLPRPTAAPCSFVLLRGSEVPDASVKPHLGRRRKRTWLRPPKFLGAALGIRRRGLPAAGTPPHTEQRPRPGPALRPGEGPPAPQPSLAHPSVIISGSRQGSPRSASCPQCWPPRTARSAPSGPGSRVAGAGQGLRAHWPLARCLPPARPLSRPEARGLRFQSEGLWGPSRRPQSPARPCVQALAAAAPPSAVHTHPGEPPGSRQSQASGEAGWRLDVAT